MPPSRSPLSLVLALLYTREALPRHYRLGSVSAIDPILARKRVVICAGAGGVGKTTTAAALALGLAVEGRKVAVVTIDPARRLATSLGLATLGNEPRRVDPHRLAELGLPVRGELWALQLDAKRTFDAVIERLAPDAATREEIFANRIYQQLSNAVAGSQEFSAIAKLYELDQEGGFDVLVLDTPPARNALDFLEAPRRLLNFFQGRAIRMFLRPAGLGGRLLGRGTGVAFALLKKVTGVDLVSDLEVFFRALSGLIDGFTARAEAVEALLADPATTFLVITSPQHDPVQEAIFLHRRLRAARLPFGGLVVNRFQPRPGDATVPDAVAAQLGPDLTARVRLAAADLAALAARDAAGLARLRETLGDPPTLVVPQFDRDVYDVDGLALVRASLFAEAPVVPAARAA